MGCFQSASVNSSSPRKRLNEADGEAQAKAAAAALPQYVTADPDLGWRNITESSFPILGFNVSFQNERSGLILTDLDLISMSLNIARRAANLADQYGVTDERDLQSQMNILDTLEWHNDVEPLMAENVDKDMQKILKCFGCPRFNWKLVSRLEETVPLIHKAPQIFLQTPALEDRAALSELASVPDFLQLMKNQKGKLCVVDVGEVAMNIAEQLLRLEKSETAGAAPDAAAPADAPEQRPTELFGWKILDNMSGVSHVGQQSRIKAAVPVATPDGDALMLVPEELIMNVASWVQATYLTAPIL